MLRQTITGNDYMRLQALANALRNKRSQMAAELDARLASAEVLESETPDGKIVGIGTTLKMHDTATSTEYCYTLVYPGDADISSGRLSVLTPLGMAILGRSEGDVVWYQSPGGGCTIVIDEVNPVL